MSKYAIVGLFSKLATGFNPKREKIPGYGASVEAGPIWDAHKTRIPALPSQNFVRIGNMDGFPDNLKIVLKNMSHDVTAVGTIIKDDLNAVDTWLTTPEGKDYVAGALVCYVVHLTD